MGSTNGRVRTTALCLPGACVVTVALALAACTGGLNGRAICERLGGDYVGSTCQHHLTPAEVEAEQWCETHGGVYVAQDGCELGSGGP